MWEGNYSSETMDYKLFWLRFVKKIWIIVAATVIGALLVGVPYYLINVVYGEGVSYKTVSEFYLDYDKDDSGKIYDYFNYYTWSEIVDTDEFVGIMYKYIPNTVVIEDDVLRSYTDATVESDTRYLYTTVITKDADTTMKLKEAMEQAILEFGDIQKELKSVKVVTSPKIASETYPDVRVFRAFILGTIMGLFAGIVGVSVNIICDSSVCLPNVMEKRYSVKALGCLSFEESKNNICYALGKCKNAVVLWSDNIPDASGDEAVEYIRNTVCDKCKVDIVAQNILDKDFDFAAVREKDAAVLMVKAGAKNGKRIERVIEELKRQDICLAGAFLYNEDKKLIKHYYG